MAEIHLLFTGGTISMRYDPIVGGNVPALDGAALLREAGGLEGLGPLRTEDWERLPAVHRGPERLWALRSRIAELVADPDVRGVVVPHGTDTLSETAYLVGRTVPPTRPVVFTGAMLTSSEPRWDGPRNMADAVRVVADVGSDGRGSLVVFHGLILQGIEAAKMHTSDLNAFGAPYTNPVGRVEGDTVSWQRDSGVSSVVAPSGLSARVALLTLVLGDQGALLDLARATHDGVVIVGFGRGNVPPGAVPAIDRWLEEGKPIVLASRCPFGEVGPDYAFEGGGGQLLRRGVLAAGARTAGQAHLELMIALSAGVSYGGTLPHPHAR